MTESQNSRDFALFAITETPCNCLNGRLRDICEGTANGISRKLRNEYLDLWLSDGTLTADPRVRQQESRQPREKRERTPEEERSRYHPGILCRHAGEVLRVESCKVCGGRKDVQILACAIHGECTVGEHKLPYKKCIRCREYDQPYNAPQEVANG